MLCMNFYLATAFTDFGLTGGVDDTLTFTDAMICEKSIYDITAKYVPYSPTYQELVARVTALETASTTTVSEEATV